MKEIKQVYDYNPKLAVKDQLFTPLSGVRLGDGLYKTVFDNNRQFLRKLDMGKMMYWFDDKTGTPTDSEPYRGHFEDNLKGSTLSMFLMGAANSLRWCDDDELAQRIHILMQRLITACEDDGFCMPVDKHNFAHREYPHYVRIWLTYALCAVGLSRDEGAYKLLRRWQDWFDDCNDLPIIKYLELAFQGIVASTYMYTTPIGEKKDIDATIEAYEEPWRLAQFMRRERDCVHIRKQPGAEPHAHGSELEGIEGYLDLYRATGRNYYLTAVKGAWELYHRDWEHIGGGIVMCEGMSTNYPGCYWLDMKNHYNELCCTAFWLFLNLRLHRLFPDEEIYMNEVEKSLFNIAFANQDGGEGIRYFAYLEGNKQESGLVHCCCGVGTRIFASLPEFIYSVSEPALSVNLYTNSEIAWERRDGIINVKMEADIPYSDDVKLTLNMTATTTFALRLRIPDWCAADAEITVNGHLAAIGKAGSYAIIEREFNDGDVIEYKLTQTFKLTKYTGADELPNFTRYYIERGPALFAVKSTDYKKARNIGWSASDFEKWLIPTQKPLNFKIAMHDDCMLVPYFELGGEQMTCCPIFND